MTKKPDILATKLLAQTRLFGIEQVDLRFSNGVTTTYERMRSSGAGAVLIIPLIDPETVLMIREYAVGVDRYELALPKGRMEVGEDMLDAANRELMEEVGYGANQLQHLSSVTLAPGYFGHVTHIILARDLYEKRLLGDEPEEIEVVPWKIKDLASLLARADCTEARTIAALYMVKQQLMDEVYDE